MSTRVQERPLVAHYRESFPILSETFIRETISRHQRYDAVMVCHNAVADVADTDVEVVRLPEGRSSGIVHGLPSVRIRRRRRLLRPLLGRIRPTVVHAHFGEEGVIAAAPTSQLGIPLVVSFYGYDATELAGSAHWRRRFRGLFGSAVAVLAEGPHMAARLEALGASSAQVVVHPIPVRLDLFPFCPASAPTQGEPTVVLQACRFVEKKGVDVTIAAFARIAGDAPSSVLWLMGAGVEEGRLRRLAADTGLGDRIRFLAPASHEAYAAVMRNAHIFVQPSRTARNGDGEGGAPTALLEAQALGLPIVSTTHADIPSVVHRDGALLAPPDDIDAVARHLLHLLRSPGEWRERATAGRRFVAKRHDSHRLAARLEDLYDSVVT